MTMQILTLNEKSHYNKIVTLIRNTDKTLNWTDKQIFESFNFNGLLFGILEDEKLISVAIFSYIIDTAELLYICTDKHHQNRGLALSLLEFAGIKLKSKNVEKIFLEANVNNNKAIKLYKKLDFKEISQRKDYYHNKDGSLSDAIIFQKNI